MSHEFPSFESPQHLIVDSANQLYQFKFLRQLSLIKEEIQNTNFKTLQDYTGLTTEVLEKAKPGICEKYNALVQKIQAPDLTLEEYESIFKECWNITH